MIFTHWYIYFSNFYKHEISELDGKVSSSAMV